jgi:16S rRNA (guanine(966)-N(2))-methyltransferase RsmD
MSRLERGGAVLTGGAARGAKLLTVPGLDIRPALARLRNSVFEVLRPRLEGATVLDLFAGIGTMGLEALSRGAGFAAFVDSDPRCVEAVRRNLSRLRFADRAEVLLGDALEAPTLTAPLGRRFDVVFVDPPYALYDDPASAARLEAAVAGLGGWGEAVVEHRSIQTPAGKWAGGSLADRRKYGGTTVSWYTGPGSPRHG